MTWNKPLITTINNLQSAAKLEAGDSSLNGHNPKFNTGSYSSISDVENSRIQLLKLTPKSANMI
jgi:hypothetical protein